MMGPAATRIRNGVLLALSAAALLWLDGRFEPGRMALLVVVPLALGGVLELDRMGHLAPSRLRFGLVPAVLGNTFLIALELVRPTGMSSMQILLALYGVTLLGACAWLAVPRTGAPEDSRPHSLRFVGVASLALWLVPPLFALVLVDRDFGVTGMAVLVVLAKVGDNAGYFVGRAIGRRHPFPRLSPGKTVAGCVASLLAAIVLGAVVLPLTLGERDSAGVLLGALLGGAINLAAQAGDLLESGVKRRSGVKDSSALLGPTGGLLDVIDSLLLATPTALLAWSWVYGESGR